MDGDYDDPGPDDTASASESLHSDDVPRADDNIVVDAADRWVSVDEHQRPARADGHNASISRDIDSLVQLKLLRKAL
jgi:hypothetical protein